MKHIQIRLEDQEYEALRERSRKLFGDANIQKAGREAVVSWAFDANQTPVIGSRISDAILHVEKSRDILLDIRHGLAKGDTVPAPSGDIPRAITGVPGAQGEHSRAVGDLGPRTEEPGAWRKLPKPKGPTRTGPT